MEEEEEELVTVAILVVLFFPPTLLLLLLFDELRFANFATSSIFRLVSGSPSAESNPKIAPTFLTGINNGSEFTISRSRIVALFQTDLLLLLVGRVLCFIIDFFFESVGGG